VVRRIVKVADMAVSASRGDRLITHALGSCLGIAVHDAGAGVGGLLHVMLPLSSADPEKAAENPFLFVDTGVPELFRACYRLGARKERMIVKAAGGAAMNGQSGEDCFQIGRRNFVVLRKLLWKNSIFLTAWDVGGSGSRSMSIEVGSGIVILKSNGRPRRL
jgi:chemotaxis protein CheD